MVARQWPVDGAIAENGAIALIPVRPLEGARRVHVQDPVSAEVRRARRLALTALSEDLLCKYPELRLTDDAPGRLSDCTFDIGEHQLVPPEVVSAARREAEQRGARTFLSSIHLHLSFDAADKASGAISFLRRSLGEDPSAALRRWAYVGDSANDAPAFAAFRTSFGVANVRRNLGGLTLAPRYVSGLPAGRGFVQIAAALSSLREHRPLAPRPDAASAP